MSNLPILSVIVPSFNQLAGLKRTAEVFAGFSEVELIVVDGDSTDGSKGWLLENQRLFAKVISAPDRGIYDAMNKGLEISSGAWCWFVGTGDLPVDGAVDEVITAVKMDTESDLHAFNVRILPPREPGVPEFYEPVWGESLKWRNTMHHQGVIYRKSSIKKLGYDIRFRVLADYHLNLKLYMEGAKCISHNTLIAEVEAGGVSRNFNKRLYAEERMMKRNVFGLSALTIAQEFATRGKYLWKKFAAFRSK